MQKQKIINDPLLGFLTVPQGILLEICNHKYFQRLRHIVQMGLSMYVYPGAVHTRLNHSLGCLMLMREAISTLKAKGVEVSSLEEKAVCVAILLHDIGHGPFSHVLERIIIPTMSHEEFSLRIMEELEASSSTASADILKTAILIFKNGYHRPFLHQLISSQLDIDRLDYLNRDSFYTGVAEGAVGAQRIIRMMNVKDDQLVLEEKAIYSLEKFILSRRLMYMQVYLHKTSLGAERLLIESVKRARKLMLDGVPVFANEHLHFFLENKYDGESLETVLQHYLALDDNDIWTALKEWSNHKDKILSTFSNSLLQRKLFKSVLQAVPFEEKMLSDLRCRFGDEFVITEEVPVKIYKAGSGGIHILQKSGYVTDITELSDLINYEFANKKELKYLLCYPK
ncbi:MAG: HD domain-containing protein [Bacteroidales bacterium]|nr:HD domain-containing protein [Bacteroidales bacterium]